MTKVKITDQFLRNQKPAEKRYEISDEIRPGLRLRVAPTGRMTWSYEKRVKGGPKRKHSLGQYPHVSIKEARKTALEIQVEADAGIDRVAVEEERKVREAEELAASVTVRELLSMYYDLHTSNLKSCRKTMTALWSAFEGLEDVPASKITNSTLQKIIDAKSMSGAKIYANRYKAMLTTLSKFARARGYFKPGVGVELQKAVKESARDRELSIAEMQAIYTASYGLSDLWGPCVRLLLLTAQRKSEIAALRWSEVNFEGRYLNVGAERTKNGQGHITHLNDPALEELKWLYAWRDEDQDLVFTTTGVTPVSGFGKMRAELGSLVQGDLEPWTIHDFRTGFATIMCEAGEDEGVVDRILNHVASSSAPSAVARIYNRAKKLPQRRQVLDRWGRMLTSAEPATVHRIA